MDLAPVAVTGPDGTRYEPVRAVIADGTFTVTDKAGTVLAASAVTTYSQGRRAASVQTAEGVWSVQTLCGCSASKRALLREWEAA